MIRFVRFCGGVAVLLTVLTCLTFFLASVQASYVTRGPSVQVGSFASIPSNCNPADSYIFSDAPWLILAQCGPTANVWQYLSRNGAVTLPPAAASWTQVNWNGSAVTDQVGTVRLVGTVTTANGQNQIRGLALTAPVTAYTRTLHIRFLGQQQSLTLAIVVGFRESATDKSANFAIQKQTGATVFDSFNGYWDTSNDTTITAFGTAWTGYQFDGNAGLIKVRISDNLTNIKFEINPQGTDWVTLADVARTTHFTTAPDQFMWGIITNSVAATSGVTATLYSLEQ